MKTPYRTWFALASLVITTVGCGGAGDTHESIARESIRTYRQYVDVLTTIVDKQSAERAKPRLEKLQQQLADQSRRIEQLGNPGHKEAIRLSQELASESRPVMLRLEKEMMRIRKNQGVMDSIGAP